MVNERACRLQLRMIQSISLGWRAGTSAMQVPLQFISFPCSTHMEKHGSRQWQRKVNLEIRCERLTCAAYISSLFSNMMSRMSLLPLTAVALSTAYDPSAPSFGCTDHTNQRFIQKKQERPPLRCQGTT